MKICIINNLYSPYNRGGVESVVEKQVNQFQQQGHDVFVITTKSYCWLHAKRGAMLQQNAQQGSKYNLEPALSAKIYRFYPLNIFSVYSLNKYPIWLRLIWRVLDVFNFHSYFKIKKILLKQKPDIIYAHNLTGLGYLIPSLINKLKIKYIQTMHDVALVNASGLLIYAQESNWLNKSWLAKIYQKITRYLFNSPDEVRFPSEWLKDFYEQYNFFAQAKKIVVRNFEIKIEDLLSNKRLKDSNKVNLLYIGQIEEHKGILFLIKALEDLRFMIYDLRIIGDGSKLEKVKQLAGHNSNIQFSGYQPQEKVQGFLEQTDYLIVPSLCYENSPTVIFEALKNKVPVVASNLGGIPELVENNKNGYLLKPGDKMELIKILKNAIIKTSE